MRTGVQVLSPEPPAPLVLPTKTATLVHITQTRITPISRTFGNYVIPACKKDEPYTILKISAARGVIDLGDKRRQEFIITAEEIAIDLARHCNSELWGIGSGIAGEDGEASIGGFAGVFVADGEEPTAEELAEAHALLRQTYEFLVKRAHAEWDQFHRPDMIHASFKRAARYLNIEADWLYATDKNLPECPLCGSKLKTPTASVCATCGRDIRPNGQLFDNSAVNRSAPMRRKPGPKPKAKVMPSHEPASETVIA